MRAPGGSTIAALSLLAGCGASPTSSAATAELRLLAGANQSQVAGYPLADTVVVRLVDADGQPVAFAPVDAAVDATDEAPFAAVTSIDARTRADGTARFTWRLGLAFGSQTLRVTSGATAGSAPLSISATAVGNHVRALSGDQTQLCAVDLGGQLGCWLPLDDPDRPPRFIPHPTAQRFSALAMYGLAGGGHRGCALATGGRVWCFDVDAAQVTGLAEVGGGYPTLVAIATGSSDLDADPPFCGRTADGAAWCWGRNDTGALGDGSTTDRDQPVAVATPVRFTRLAVGSHHACGLSSTGSIWCWGSNESSQIGLVAGSAPITTPRRIAELITFADVAVVTDHATCGIGIGGGGAWCWGRKTDLGIGPLALGLIEGPATPQAIYVSELDSPSALGRLEGAVVAVGSAGKAAWWGDLTADVALVNAISPRPFVKKFGLRSLAMPASRGIVCGAATGSDDQPICARIASLTGYPSFQEHPVFAGFGMPLP